MGVEIYKGLDEKEVIYNEEGEVIGVEKGEMGVEREGKSGNKYKRGMEMIGKYVMIGEGESG